MQLNTRAILTPRYMDADNFNPQNSNAQNMLSRWQDDELRISTLCYNAPRQDVAGKASVNLIKLWRWRFWRLSAWLAYQRRIDAVFYPGADVSDDLGWRFRDWTGRRVPIIATLEGLVGNSEREQEYTAWAGHPVFCQYVGEKVLARIDKLYERADHIIAISPFLAEMGRRRYGDKFSVLPLGLDAKIFYADDSAKKNERVTVICAGRLYANKRPDLFIDLAARFPDADFIWYGWGELLEPLRSQAKEMKLNNLAFPGPAAPDVLVDAMRKAHLFVLPSRSEGVPKVTQEAAACGLPQVIFGFYEAPTVVHGKNGLVVWSDEDFIDAVSSLVHDRGMLIDMGKKSAEMAKEWDWDRVAPLWSDAIKDGLNG